MNRTTTWDKAPLENDPWLEFHLKQPQECQWHAESTQVSDCDEDDKHCAISCQSEVLSSDEDDRENVVSKHHDLEVSADAEDFEEDWDEIIALAARPQTDFGGSWVPASIFGDMLFWNEGEEVSIEVLSSKKFSMCYVGLTYVAELSDDGTLHWDDGDIWCRRDSVTCKKNDMQTCDQNLSHKDLKFDGVWGPAYLKEIAATYSGVDAFLHINDCDVKPRQGDEVEFRLALDNKGNPKAVKVQQAPIREVINARDWFALRQRR